MKLYKILASLSKEIGINGIKPHLKLGLRDYTPFEIRITGLQPICDQQCHALNSLHYKKYFRPCPPIAPLCSPWVSKGILPAT